jgi:tetratricopeptide (TPR) repeat protein
MSGSEPRLIPADREKQLGSVVRHAIEQLADAFVDNESVAMSDLASWLAAGEPLALDYVLPGLKALASHAVAAERPDLVVELFSEAAILDPTNPGWPYDVGTNLARLGHVDRAIDAYGAALDIDPRFAYALFNRGRLLCDRGRADQGIDDFAAAVRAGLDFAGYDQAIAGTVIRELGFRRMVDFAVENDFSPQKTWSFLGIIGEAITEAAVHGAFYIAFAAPHADDSVSPADALEALWLRAELADMVRELPVETMAGGLYRDNDDAYLYDVVDTDSLAGELWYRPLAWGDTTPRGDPVARLDRLEAIRAAAIRSDLPLVQAAADYMSAGVVLSTVWGDRNDWPVPVFRLAVPLESRANGLHADEQSVDAINSWLDGSSRGPGVVDELSRTSFAGFHLESAAQALLRNELTRSAPQPVAAPVSDDGEPIMYVGEGVTSPPARQIATRVWSQAEPVFREWVMSCLLGDRTTEHIYATSSMRQFGVTTSTGLWHELDVPAWRACRRTVLESYALPRDDIDAVFHHDALLVDYYIHEIVETTIVRLAATAREQTALEVPVDVMQDDLTMLLAANRRGVAPAGEYPRLVDDLLLADLPRLDGAGPLVVVPFGYLRNLPFHTLPSVREAITAGEFTGVSSLPSAAFVPRSRAPVPRPRRCLVVGTDTPGTVDVGAELAVLRSYFDDVTVLRDNDATVDAVLGALQEHDLAHFTCHGDTDPYMGAGYLELADGRLHPWDVVLLDCAPETVVLNACLSGTAESFEATSDSTLGLHAAFLVAGTQQVVGGMWDISEWTALRFAESFYRHWMSDGLTACRSVTCAQDELRAETTDPFLWAPHAHFGNWY